MRPRCRDGPRSHLRSAPSSTSFPTRGSSRARRRPSCSIRCTRAPNRRSSCASSIPTGPPPSTHTLPGTSGSSSPRGLSVARHLEAGDLGHGRFAAGRDHDPLAGEDLISDADAAGDERGPPFDDLDPLLLVALDLIRVVEVPDHEIAVLRDRVPSVGRARRCRPCGWLGADLGRAEQRLRRHARPVGAFATDQLALDQRGRQAVLAEARGHDFARRPSANHNRIETFPGHGGGRYPGFRADQTDQPSRLPCVASGIAISAGRRKSDGHEHANRATPGARRAHRIGATRSPVRNELPTERLDRNSAELMAQLRVAGTGIQVLLAFLLVVPFNARWSQATAFDQLRLLRHACCAWRPPRFC